jgi:hypothetical protein
VGTEGDGRELAIRTTVAVLTGAASLLGPDVAAAATALAPVMEAALTKVAPVIGQRRFVHAAETVADAAQTSGSSVEDLLEKAVSDDRRHELLSRVLGIAQDTALRDKRRALGRALAAGIAGDDARIDDELLFVRAVADVDIPHIKLLKILSEDQQPIRGSLGGSVVNGWSLTTVAAQHPEFGGTLPALIWTLESHALVQTTRIGTPSSAVQYGITSAGRHLLDRLAADVPEPFPPD